MAVQVLNGQANINEEHDRLYNPAVVADRLRSDAYYKPVDDTMRLAQTNTALLKRLDIKKGSEYEIFAHRLLSLLHGFGSGEDLCIVKKVDDVDFNSGELILECLDESMRLSLFKEFEEGGSIAIYEVTVNNRPARVVFCVRTGEDDRGRKQNDVIAIHGDVEASDFEILREIMSDDQDFLDRLDVLEANRVQQDEVVENVSLVVPDVVDAVEVSLISRALSPNGSHSFADHYGRRRAHGENVIDSSAEAAQDWLNERPVMKYVVAIGIFVMLAMAAKAGISKEQAYDDQQAAERAEAIANRPCHLSDPDNQNGRLLGICPDIDEEGRRLLEEAGYDVDELIREYVQFYRYNPDY